MLENNLDIEYAHIGAELCAKRKTAGYSLQDVTSQTHIQTKYLDALERLDKDPLPSLGYAVGFVRTYARFLGVDEKQAIERFKTDIEASESFNISREPKYLKKRSLQLPKGSFAIGTVLSCALVVVTWYGMKTDARSEVKITEPAVVAKNWGFEPVQPIQNDPNMISLRAVGPSWVEVKDGSGTTLISRIMVPGEIFETDRKNAPILSLRDAGAVELFIGGERIGFIGQRGAPAHNIALSEVRQ